MISEFIQDTSLKEWYYVALSKKSLFLYLLEWDAIRGNRDSQRVMKFGYKTSSAAFKNSYGKPHHTIPRSSMIWVIEKEAVDHRRRLAKVEKLISDHELKDAVFSLEVNIHNLFKRDERFNTAFGYREYYFQYDLLTAKDIVRSELDKFECKLVQDRIRKKEKGYFFEDW